MSDLPKSLRGELANYFSIWTSQVVSHSRDEDGTEKLLLQLHDGGRVECVLLRDAGRRTLCISTQVGCGMGCVFCASGLDGVDRNLSSGEIVEQLLLLQRLLPGKGGMPAQAPATSALLLVLIPAEGRLDVQYAIHRTHQR